MKEVVTEIIILACICIGIFGLIVFAEYKFNSKSHSEDVKVTEWVSPDGVHYWYQQAGYHAMLAPRYDCDGNLILDKKGNNNEVK